MVCGLSRRRRKGEPFGRFFASARSNATFSTVPLRKHNPFVAPLLRDARQLLCCRSNFARQVRCGDNQHDGPRHLRAPSAPITRQSRDFLAAAAGLTCWQPRSYDGFATSSATPTTKSRITRRWSPAPSPSRSNRSGRITIPDPRIRGRAK